MDAEIAKWVDVFLQYGVVGLGWPMAAYLFVSYMKEKDKRREDQMDMLQKSYEQSIDTVHTLNKIITILEVGR